MESRIFSRLFPALHIIHTKNGSDKKYGTDSTQKKPSASQRRQKALSKARVMQPYTDGGLASPALNHSCQKGSCSPHESLSVTKVLKALRRRICRTALPLIGFRIADLSLPPCVLPTPESLSLRVLPKPEAFSPKDLPLYPVFPKN